MPAIAELRRLLADADTHVGPDGGLPLPIRAPIRSLLRSIPGAWPRVEILSARHVLPAYEEMFHDALPRRLIEMAELALFEGSRSAELGAAAADLWWHLDELSSENDDPAAQAAIAAGYPSASAARAVIDGDRSDPLRDQEVDPYDWSASFAASMSLGSRELTPENVEKRARFWRWWLHEAVPSVLQP